MKRFLVYITLALVGCNVDFNEDKNSPAYVFNAFWNEIDRNYSFFSYKPLNWDSVYVSYKDKVTPDISNDNLFKVLSEITDLLGDAHTNIYAPQGIGGSNNYFEKYQVNEVAINDSLFEYYSTGKIYEHGKIKKSEIAYIKIKTFEGEKESFRKIDSLLQLYSMVRGLIIDVRSNRGGRISNSEIIAGSFSDSAIYAGKYRSRNGRGHDDFSEWVKLYTPLSKNKKAFKKPVAILTNRRSYSATEWFIMYARVLPGFTIIGDTTGGGSARPLLREMPNGWMLRISNTQMALPDGRDFQFKGLNPDIPVWLNDEDYRKEYDRILYTGISVLNEKIEE
jgi:hypothetical protein